MLLRVVNNTVIAEQYSAEEYRWLDENTTYGADRWSPRDKRIVTQALHLLKGKKPTFPAGLLRMVITQAEVDDVKLDVVEQPQLLVADSAANIEWLDDTQKRAFRRAVVKRNGILKLATGSGKCLGIDTPVMLYDGRVIPVQHVKAGDTLMGADSKPRTVLSTTTGYGQLYSITPRKGKPWVCNDVHVLTLKHTVSNAIEDIPLDEFLLKNTTYKHCMKQFFVPVDFPEKNLPVDPYFLGVWFGDGSKSLNTNGELNQVAVSKPDKEIYDACMSAATLHGLTVKTNTYKSCPTYRLTAGHQGDRKNTLLMQMRSLLGTKLCVPHEYLTGSRGQRMAFLAGWLDTDGSLQAGTYDIVQKREDYADAICFVARTLGLQATKAVKTLSNYGDYYRVTISGDTECLPLRIARKRAAARQQKKDVTKTGFTVEAIGTGTYYGFQLDGDGRFLLGDCTVTHNTEIAVALMFAHKCNCLFLVHKTNLLHQTAERFFLRTGERAGMIGDSVFVPGRVTIATYQTLTKMLLGSRRKEILTFLESIGIVVADECHVVPSNTAYTIVMACKRAELRIGLSATPLERTDQRSIYAVAALGPIMFKVNAAASIESGRLVAPTIRMLRCMHPRATGNWQAVYRRYVLENDLRNALIARAVKAAAKPCFVFVKQLQQGTALLKAIRRAGINADFVNGSHSTEQRKAAIKKLVRHDIDVIVTTPVFQEGVDVPALASVVMAGGGASHIAALQSIGRALRTNDGKSSAEVWDIYDVNIASLQKHSEARATAYRSEGHTVLIGSFELGFVEMKR